MIRTNDARVTQIMAAKQQQQLERARVRTYRTVTSPAGSFADRLPDGAWKGQQCFIIGGGPSLKGFDFERLRGERIIAINKAFLDVPFADIMFAMDRPFLDLITSGKLGENYRRAFESFWGVKLWLDLSNYSYPAGVYFIPSAGDIGWTKSLKEGLFHGQNSGYGALNLAMVLGADPIYLLGYDCAKGPDGEKNYHNGYPSGGNPDALNIFKRSFEEGAAMLKGGLRIVNLNPNSALRCFEFGDVYKVLPAAKGRMYQRITVITPTGDRPLAFALCQQWMRNQTRRPDQWIVVDDGKMPLTPTPAMQYVRREPAPGEPRITLGLNILKAIDLIRGDLVFIMEDDDYYAPDYIATLVEKLEQQEIVGIGRARYYHISSGQYYRHPNITHASFGSTAFKKSIIPALRTAAKNCGDFIDMALWKEVAGRGLVFLDDDENPLHCSIKAMPGRFGVSHGHNSRTSYYRHDDSKHSILKTWTGKASDVYVGLAQKTMNEKAVIAWVEREMNQWNYSSSITGVTVCWNTKDLIECAHNSIRRFHPDMPLIVIDGSDPGDTCAAYVRGLASDKTAVVSLGYNIGHGRGMCMGIEKVKTKYALIFDSDIEMLISPIGAMLTMMEDDTFGVGYIEKTGFDGFEYGVHPQHAKEGWMPYLHPYFQLINIENYRKFHPYVHHGAPCYLTMLDIYKKGLSGKIIKEFPGLGHSSGQGHNWKGEPREYIRHDPMGTRGPRKAMGLGEIEGGWVMNKGQV